MNSDRIKSLANIVASNLSEAANRTKRNPTRDFLRRYPVSDTEIVRPVKKQEKKKPEQGMAEGYEERMKAPGWHSASQKNPNFNDELSNRRVNAVGKRLKSGKLSADERGSQERLKTLMKFLRYKGGLTGPKSPLPEEQSVAEAVPYAYGFVKRPRKGSVAYNAMMKRKEQDRNRVKEIEAIGTKNHHIGVAKVTKEQIEDVAETYKYIDQSGGHQIKGKSGTFVGYTHSATKGKGANILKHNATKKYYAAGGSSTAFTAKTTLHDTPQDAARAYHKGNLAEELDSGDSELEKAMKRRNAVYQSNRQSIDIHKSGIKADNSEYAHEKNTDRLNQLRNKDFEKNQARKDREDKALLKKNNPGPLKTLKQAMENFTIEGIVDSLADAERDRQIKNNTADLDRKKKLNSVEAAKELAKVKKSEDDAKYYRGEQVEVVNNEAYMGKVKLVSNPREKWMKSVKDRGYDMRAGAQRLQDLLDKQKKERAEIEQRAKEKGLEY